VSSDPRHEILASLLMVVESVEHIKDQLGKLTPTHLEPGLEQVRVRGGCEE
jgi:hypothetical protein